MPDSAKRSENALYEFTEVSFMTESMWARKSSFQTYSFLALSWRSAIVRRSRGSLDLQSPKGRVPGKYRH